MDAFDQQSDKQVELQRRVADLASLMAELADHNAAFMEGIADDARWAGEHAVRRGELAVWEREVAGVGRRNADRLRAGETDELEPPPLLRARR